MKFDTKKNKENFFNFSKQLFSNYNTLQIHSELVNKFETLANKYDINILIDRNIRILYNQLINRFYHNEITIKSNFINNVLLKSNNHVTIFELNLHTSRVDLCKINGKSIAYEIKTDLDNFSRLEKQIKDYSKIFEQTYVICSLNNVNNILSIIPHYCGVYSYHIRTNGTYVFRKEKQAQESNNLDSFSQLNLLSKKDIETNFKSSTLNMDKLVMINEIIPKYSSKYINSTFKKIIKKKYKNKWDFLKQNHDQIYEIDYQWFFKNNINPNIIYQ